MLHRLDLSERGGGVDLYVDFDVLAVELAQLVLDELEKLDVLVDVAVVDGDHPALLLAVVSRLKAVTRYKIIRAKKTNGLIKRILIKRRFLFSYNFSM